MILIAFTNYNSAHMPPGKLFTWVGLETFSEIFAMTEGASKGATFVELTKWTLIWAVFATVLNYLFGMILALMINKKGRTSKWNSAFLLNYSSIFLIILRNLST